MFLIYILAGLAEYEPKMKLRLKNPRNYINHSKNSFNVGIWAFDLGHFQFFITGFKLFLHFCWLGGI